MNFSNDELIILAQATSNHYFKMKKDLERANIQLDIFPEIAGQLRSMAKLLAKIQGEVDFGSRLNWKEIYESYTKFI